MDQFGFGVLRSRPGRAPELPELIAVVARRAGVDPSTVRQIAGAGSDFALYAGLGSDGVVHVARGNPRRASDFVAAGDFVADPITGGRAVVAFVSVGGPEPTVLDHAKIVGFVRDDVARATVLTPDGSELPLAVNDWRAFAYAGRHGALPRAVRAFDADGKPLDEKTLVGIAPPRPAYAVPGLPPGPWELGLGGAAAGNGSRAGVGPQ